MTRETSDAGSDRGPDYWDVHCSRCSDETPRDRESRICESSEKHIQHKKILDGIPCEQCDGHGYVYGTICDLQRAMNGRDELCPECHGSGRVAWQPDPDDVHPDLRNEVRPRVE